MNLSGTNFFFLFQAGGREGTGGSRWEIQNRVHCMHSLYEMENFHLTKLVGTPEPLNLVATFFKCGWMNIYIHIKIDATKLIWATVHAPTQFVGSKFYISESALNRTISKSTTQACRTKYAIKEIVVSNLNFLILIFCNLIVYLIKQNS